MDNEPDDRVDRLRGIVATVLGVEVDILSDDTSPETLSAWTSLQHLALVAALEEAFSIQFSMAEMTGTRSIGALRQVVSAHLARSIQS